MSSAHTQQPIKALFVLDQVNRGGIEMQALDALRAARGSGLEITVVTTGGQLLSEFRSAGDVVVLNRRWPIDPGYASQIRRTVEERNCNIVQGHQAVDALHILLTTRRMPHVKRVLTIEGFIPDRKNRKALKLLIPRMDAVVFPSHALQSWVAQHDGLFPKGNAVVIANGTDPARLDVDRSDVRAELGISSDAFVIGMVGNFYRDPRKDHLTLIKSLPTILREHRDTHCLIVGGVEPGAEHKLNACKVFVQENGMDERVHFLGSRDDIPAILASLDLFVFSSLHEGGSPPIAVIEAMLKRVPVIISDIAPHIEYSSKADVSVLFKTGDETDLAVKVNSMLSDRDRMSRSAERAYTYANENFTAVARLERFRKLYERLLAE